MNFARDTLNSGPINGLGESTAGAILTAPAVLTVYARAALLTAEVDGLTAILVPYENRTGRPPYENRVLRIPRGL